MTCASEMLRRDGLSDVDVKRRLARCYHLLLSHSRPKDVDGCDTLGDDVHAVEREGRTREQEKDVGEQGR